MRYPFHRRRCTAVTDRNQKTTARQQRLGTVVSRVLLFGSGPSSRLYDRESVRRRLVLEMQAHVGNHRTGSERTPGRRVIAINSFVRSTFDRVRKRCKYPVSRQDSKVLIHVCVYSVLRLENFVLCIH